MSAPQVPADVAVVLLAESAGADALEGVDQFGELDFGRVVHERWTWSCSPLNCFSSASKSAQTSRMISSVRVSMASVNAFRRYLVTKTK